MNYYVNIYALRAHHPYRHLKNWSTLLCMKESEFLCNYQDGPEAVRKVQGTDNGPDRLPGRAEESVRGRPEIRMEGSFHGWPT